MDQSIRTILKKQEAAGELVRIKKQVDPRDNMSFLQWQCSNKLGKSALFDNVKGYPGWSVYGQTLNNRRKIALAFETEPDKVVPTLVERMEHGKVPWTLVNSAPVKEVIQKGDDADLTQIPAFVVSEEDAGPYISSGMLIVKDPDTGTQNVSIHRLQVKGRNRTGLALLPRQTLLIYEKYRARKLAMPVAVAIGTHPALYLAAAHSPNLGEDEYGIAGALLEEPVRMVKCETVDLAVPAEAEIVLEGEVPFDFLEDEGPFGEFTGFYASKSPRHVINIKTITRRKDAMYYGLQCGLPICDTHAMLAMTMEAGLWNTIRNVEGYIDLRDIVVMPQASSMMVIVKFRPRYEGQAKNVLAAALSSPYLHLKVAIAVDDDVDATNLADVMWAATTRAHFGKDLITISGARMHPLDWSADSIDLNIPGSDYQRVATKLGIDATKPSISRMVEREKFRKTFPKGWGKGDITDYIS